MKRALSGQMGTGVCHRLTQRARGSTPLPTEAASPPVLPPPHALPGGPPTPLWSCRRRLANTGGDPLGLPPLALPRRARSRRRRGPCGGSRVGGDDIGAPPPPSPPLAPSLSPPLPFLSPRVKSSPTCSSDGWGVWGVQRCHRPALPARFVHDVGALSATAGAAEPAYLPPAPPQDPVYATALNAARKVLHHSQYYVMRPRRRDMGRFSDRVVWVYPGEHGPDGHGSSYDDAATRTAAFGKSGHGTRSGAPDAAAGAHPTTAAVAREVNHGGRGSSDVDGAASDIEPSLSTVTKAGKDVAGRETGPPYHGSSPAPEILGGSSPFQSRSDEHNSSTSAAASEGSSTRDSSSDDVALPDVHPDDAVGSEADDATYAEDDGVDGPQTPSSGTVQDMTINVPHCTAVFCSVEDRYGLLLLRGPGCLWDYQYEPVWEGFNISSPVSLPSLADVRETLTSRAGAWLLPLQSLTMAVAGHVGHVPVACTLPRAHVRRDVAFEATFQNVLAAEQRPDEERVLQPKFIDSST